MKNKYIYLKLLLCTTCLTLMTGCGMSYEKLQEQSNLYYEGYEGIASLFREFIIAYNEVYWPFVAVLEIVGAVLCLIPHKKRSLRRFAFFGVMITFPVLLFILRHTLPHIFRALFLK